MGTKQVSSTELPEMSEDEKALMGLISENIQIFMEESGYEVEKITAGTPEESDTYKNYQTQIDDLTQSSAEFETIMSTSKDPNERLQAKLQKSQVDTQLNDIINKKNDFVKVKLFYNEFNSPLLFV